MISRTKLPFRLSRESLALIARCIQQTVIVELVFVISPRLFDVALVLPIGCSHKIFFDRHLNLVESLEQTRRSSQSVQLCLDLP